jgi:hypothetical protein
VVVELIDVVVLATGSVVVDTNGARLDDEPGAMGNGASVSSPPPPPPHEATTKTTARAVATPTIRDRSRMRPVCPISE